MKTNCGHRIEIQIHSNSYYAMVKIDTFVRYLNKNGTWGYSHPIFFDSRRKVKKFILEMKAQEKVVPFVTEEEREERQYWDDNSEC